MHNTFVYERIEFNADHIASLSIDDFTAENIGKYFKDQDEATKKEKLKEVYEGCKAVVNIPTPEAVKAESVKSAKK